MARVIYLSKNNIRDAWLSALAQVLYTGDEIKTEYDKPNDLPSKDATVLIEVKEPFNNPIMRGNKLLKIKTKYGNSYEVFGNMADTFLIGSIQSGYIEEILEGVNDHYIWNSDTSFPYSYHDRIFNYTPFALEDTIHIEHKIEPIDNEIVKKQKKLMKAEKIKRTDDSIVWKFESGFELDLDRKISDQIGIKSLPLGIFNFPRINQIDYIIDKLKKNPYSRRAQAITWRPLVDPFHFDPPCLQRIFMRIKEGKLLMQTTWRSRDLFRAWEANVNGMIRIQKNVADKLEVDIGHYLDFSNSLHIYGVNIPDVKDMFNRMINKGEQLPEDVIELLK